MVTYNNLNLQYIFAFPLIYKKSELPYRSTGIIIIN